MAVETVKALIALPEGERGFSTSAVLTFGLHILCRWGDG